MSYGKKFSVVFWKTGSFDRREGVSWLKWQQAADCSTRARLQLQMPGRRWCVSWAFDGGRIIVAGVLPTYQSSTILPTCLWWVVWCSLAICLYRSVIIAGMLCAFSAWWEFTSPSSDRQRIVAFIHCGVRRGFCPRHGRGSNFQTQPNQPTTLLSQPNPTHHLIKKIATQPNPSSIWQSWSYEQRTNY